MSRARALPIQTPLGCSANSETSVFQQSVLMSGAGVVVVIGNSGNHRFSSALNVKVISFSGVLYAKKCRQCSTRCSYSVIQDAVHLETIEAKGSEFVICHESIRQHACSQCKCR